MIILDVRNYCELKDTFQKTKAYSYKPSLLNILIEKTSLFLLNYFQEIFKNCEKSKLYKSKKKTQYQLVILKKTINLKCLLIKYNTNILLLSDSYDYWYKKLDNNEILICEHSYHFECY